MTDSTKRARDDFPPTEPEIWGVYLSKNTNPEVANQWADVGQSYDYCLSHAKDYAETSFYQSIEVVRLTPDGSMQVKGHAVPHMPTLDERMQKAAMIPLSIILKGEDAMAKWRKSADVTDLRSFTQWVNQKHAEYSTMMAKYLLSHRPPPPKEVDDPNQMWEWYMAHSAVYSEVVANWRTVNIKLVAQLVVLRANLEVVRKETFGDTPGDEPDVFADYDRAVEIANMLTKTIESLEKLSGQLTPPSSH